MVKGHRLTFVKETKSQVFNIDITSRECRGISLVYGYILFFSKTYDFRMEQEIIFRKSICLGHSRFQIGKKNIYLDTGEPCALIGEYLKN